MRCEVPTRRRRVKTVARSRRARARRMSARCHSSGSRATRSVPVSTFTPGTPADSGSPQFGRLAGLSAAALAKRVGTATVALGSPRATLCTCRTQGPLSTRHRSRSPARTAGPATRRTSPSSALRPTPTLPPWSTPLGAGAGRRRSAADLHGHGTASRPVRPALPGGRRPPPRAADTFIAGTLDDVTRTNSDDTSGSGQNGDGRTGGPPAGHRLSSPGAVAATAAPTPVVTAPGELLLCPIVTPRLSGVSMSYDDPVATSPLPR